MTANERIADLDLGLELVSHRDEEVYVALGTRESKDGPFMSGGGGGGLPIMADDGRRYMNTSMDMSKSFKSSTSSTSASYLPSKKSRIPLPTRR